MSESTDIIIIGGGAAGCSAAMQLSARGRKVLVLERSLLGSGSTGRAAGLGAQLRESPEETSLLMKGIEVVKDIERKVKKEIFTRTGSLHVAADPERARELRDFVKMGKEIGFEIDLVDADFARRRLPCMRADDLIEYCYCPTDGHFDPSELLSSYIELARAGGATFITNTPVTKLLVEGGSIKGVGTPRGEHHAPIVINAAGPWSYLLAGLTSTSMATAAMGHAYLVTRPLPEVPIGTAEAALRDRKNRIYSRPEAGGMLVGTYEELPTEYDMEDLPEDFQMSQMSAPRDSLQIATLIDSASRRFPFIDERTPMTVTSGIMTFTPDGHALCGPIREVEGLYHCTGFNGRGVFQSTSVGILLADLVCDGIFGPGVEHLRADRFNDDPGLKCREDIKSRCRERYSGHYSISREKD